MLQRLPGWERRLTTFLEERRDRPFVWGSNCCASFAIAWVACLTGETVWMVDWTSAREAKESLDRAGGMRAAWTATLGRPSQNFREARRGDVGLIDIDGRLCGVVCTGATFAGPGVLGLVQRALADAQLLWRVG